MNNAFINCIEYSLPSLTLTNDQISIEHPEWEVQKIAEKTGINERRIADKTIFASDLALSAANLLFEKNKIDKSEIDLLIYCTQSPDYFIPTTACILQDQLKLSKKCGAFDYNLGCSGYIYGLSIAKAFIISGIAKKIVLITADTYSKYINPLDKSNKTIFGDAATATLISNVPGAFKILDFSFGTDGSGYNNLIVKYGGLRHFQEKGDDVFDQNNQFVKNDSNLFMNGQEIFSFTSLAVPKLIEDVLNKNKLIPQQVDYFLFHQANKFMLNFLRKKINIPEEKFISYIKNVGNTVSSSIPIALREECFTKTGLILLAGFGVGYSWAGCMIESIQE